MTEGESFTWQIAGIVDDTTNLEISWTATYKGVAVDPCNTHYDRDCAGVLHVGQYRAGHLSMLRSYAQGDDYVLGQGPRRASGQYRKATCRPPTRSAPPTWRPRPSRWTPPSRPAHGASWPCKASRSCRCRQAFDNPETSTRCCIVRVPTPIYEFIVGTGAKATTPRREIADTEQCLKCHVGSLYQHGNTRVDNVTMCIICHNSASSDQNNRVLMGVDKSEAYDGKVGQTYELKTMLHAIHSAGRAWRTTWSIGLAASMPGRPKG